MFQVARVFVIHARVVGARVGLKTARYRLTDSATPSDRHDNDNLLKAVDGRSYCRTSRFRTYMALRTHIGRQRTLSAVLRLGAVVIEEAVQHVKKANAIHPKPQGA